MLGSWAEVGGRRKYRFISVSEIMCLSSAVICLNRVRCEGQESQLLHDHNLVIPIQVELKHLGQKSAPTAGSLYIHWECYVG
jgi:hypothetical protein